MSLSLDPEMARALEGAASHLDAGRMQDAEPALNAILRGAPGQPDALHMLGHLRLRQGNVTAAVAALQQAHQGRGADAEIRASLMQALVAAGRYRDLVAVCRSALGQTPDDPNLLFNLGRALGLLGEYTEAIETLRQTIDIAGPQAPVLAALGTAYFHDGRPDEAAAAYQHALSLAPNHTETLYNLASLHMSRLDYDDAVECLNRVVACDAAHSRAFRMLGTVLGRTDRYAEAIQPLKRALELDPTDGSSAHELVYALAIAGDSGDAAAFAEDFLKRFPSAAFMHRQLAFAHLRAGAPERAIPACDAAMTSDVPPTTALALKSAALNELDRRTEAGELLGLDDLVKTVKPPPPEGYKSLAHLNDAITGHIVSHPTLDYMPSNRSMKRGRGTLELFDGNEDGPVLALKRMILDQADAYMREIPDKPDHPFIAAMPEALDANCWGNVYDRAGKQTVHFHPPAWLSGVYYPEVPDRIRDAPAGDPAGALELGRAYFRLESTDEPPVRVVKPEDGLMVLFPAYVGHQTIPIEDSDERRISIAFDLVPAEAA